MKNLLPKDKPLNLKVNKAKALIRIFLASFDKIGVACSFGKDSVVLLHLVRNFKSLPVLFNNTGDEFEEILQFKDVLSSVWDFPVIETEPVKRCKTNYELKMFGKVLPTKKALKKLGWQAIFVAIRKSEHEARKMEKPIKIVDGVIRVHPLVDWTEKDIWQYIKRNKLPYCSLYDRGYKSIGCKSDTKPTNKSERSGRQFEYAKKFKELREKGYW